MTDDGRALVLGGIAGLALVSIAQGGRGSSNAERLAATCAPAAGPGISAEVPPGHLLVYRTSRAKAETDAICAAVAAGRPAEGFRASIHRAHGISGHSKVYGDALARAQRKGKLPLFTSPYVTTAAIYRDMTGWVVGEKHGDLGAMDPVTWALLVPASAVIWKSRQAEAPTSVFHALTYSDAEIVIDARQIVRVWHVPAGVVGPIHRRVEALAERLKGEGGFRNSFKDKDDALAGAALHAVFDLRIPPTELGRPFIEAPVPLPNGGEVQKGDRVLLFDGQVVTLVDRSANGRWYRATGFSEWGKTYPTSWGWDGVNLELDFVVRAVPKGGKVTMTERVAAWRQNRGRLRELLRARIVEMHKYVRQAEEKGDEDWANRNRATIASMEGLLPVFDRESPPWA